MKIESEFPFPVKLGLSKDDKSKREQSFKAWGKNHRTRASLGPRFVFKILQVFFSKNRRGGI